MKIKLLLIVIFSSLTMSSQEKQLTLENLNDFRPQAGNWQIVGDVAMNRNIDIHDLEKSHSKSKKKKKKKKRKNRKSALAPVSFFPGTGILLNINDNSKKDALISSIEHGDIKLELDVMLPKGSNSGIYLQGRYELQLFDSWGVKNPSFSDIGGIYRNWDNRPGKIFRGISPSSNASKAPGLWQHLKIHFQAPRFDKHGTKISNAKFISVILNGVSIHSNIEVPLPTGGPISKKETSKGPLMIQGDHGPVAFKNITYQLLKESEVEISSLAYKVYKGDFKGLEDLNGQPIAIKGISKLIDVNVSNEEDKYGIEYSGTLFIPSEDTYTISLEYSGGAKLLVDAKEILKNNSSSAQGVLKTTIHLSAGQHSLSLTNIKSAPWRGPKLGLSIQSSITNPKSFNTFDSNPPSTNSISPILVNADANPKLLRGFVSFKGNQKRLSHTIAIGTPQGVNFIYDLGSANLIGAWRGNFVDATPMWHNRGDGSFKPRGAVQWTFLNQPIAELANSNEKFPKVATAPDFISKGYTIDKSSGLPIFNHMYKGVSIQNKITPDASNTYLKHTVSFSETKLTNWYYKVASGKMKRMADGSYAINHQQYYIKILSGQTPVIRNNNGEEELVLAVDGSTITYELIW